MRKLALALALAGGIVATPSSAQEMDTAFSTYGQCQSALSQWYNDQWQGEHKSNGSKGGMAGDFGYQFHCVRMSDGWYILPWLSSR